MLLHTQQLQSNSKFISKSPNSMASEDAELEFSSLGGGEMLGEEVRTKEEQGEEGEED